MQVASKKKTPRRVSEIRGADPVSLYVRHIFQTEHAGETQEALAERYGLTGPNVNRILRGQSVTLEVLRKIADSKRERVGDLLNKADDWQESQQLSPRPGRNRTLKSHPHWPPAARALIKDGATPDEVRLLGLTRTDIGDAEELTLELLKAQLEALRESGLF